MLGDGPEWVAPGRPLAPGGVPGRGPERDLAERALRLDEPGRDAVLLALRQRDAAVLVTETHPKVLYRAFWRRHYDYAAEARAMDRDLGLALGLDVRTANDHEWDAALSAFAALHVLRGDWPLDLHALPLSGGERLVTPCGPTRYGWPD